MQTFNKAGGENLFCHIGKRWGKKSKTKYNKNNPIYWKWSDIDQFNWQQFKK